MTVRLSLFTLLVALFVAACSPPPVLRDANFLNDTSLLSDEPCAAPCWRNITPGETRWNDALTLIEDDAQFSDRQPQTSQESPAVLLDFNKKDGGLRCCRIYSEDGETVSNVLTLLAPEITLGQIIAKYGEPTYFVGEGVTDDQALISILYPDIPMILYVFAAGVEQGLVNEASEIIGAIYLTPRDMQTIIGSSALYLWDGYGAIKEKLDGSFDVTPEPEFSAEATEAPSEATAEASPTSSN